MFHLTVAIARFFEFLLLDIVKSIAGLVGIALVVLVVIAVGVAVLLRLGRRVSRGRGDDG